MPSEWLGGRLPLVAYVKSILYLLQFLSLIISGLLTIFVSNLISRHMHKVESEWSGIASYFFFLFVILSRTFSLMLTTSLPVV